MIPTIPRFLPRLAPLAFGAALLGGCSLIPDYERPAAPIPAAWPQGEAYRAVSATAPGQPTADAIAWDAFFLDPGLRQLIGIALNNNRDLRVATLNVAAAEAQFRVQHGTLYPDIGASGSANYQQIPADLTNAGGNRTQPITSRTWSAGVGLTAYEVDLFGRLRSLSRSAFESYLALEETRRAAQISLVASVAQGYLAVLADRELLQLTRRTLESQETSLRLTRAAATGGTETALTLQQAQTAVETARANLSLYTRQLAQDENALAELIGQPLPPALPVAERGLDSPLLLAEVPAGLSSEVLLRRPDVLAAERSLLAANASIGAARAAFFPSVTITGQYGTSGAALSRLFQPQSGAWSFLPQIDIPIFTGGINRANLDYARLQKQVEVANYEKAIQTAFRETADALAARGTYDSQLRAQQGLTRAFAESYRLSELRFRSGVDNFLTTLVSQRDLYGAQQNLITLRQARLANLVTLYKVLGGGWQQGGTRRAVR
ncbi:efflux transporter outer membrane subunit [Teichococcus vastitatis]|uniref:Efflux transporter outer membrane subunit n=1 Tax=Teichococcus vastitatis TaxID=2307076 RepID=A0ABS9W7D1_9PROT|nr:efflux transporter outer membrane subunit [Pseudoroseomonas vastitatis]MCI0755212.1 efflux transporter outer membrane subunit [Pseudoroseomonas vastitatis]